MKNCKISQKPHKSTYFEKGSVRIQNFCARILNLLPPSDTHKVPVFIEDY
jgi:hypothetical protein